MNYGGRLYRKMVQDITVTDGDGVRDKAEKIKKMKIRTIQLDRSFFTLNKRLLRNNGSVIIAELSIDFW